MKTIIRKIEDRFDPPFAYYKHAVSGYVVRPLNWEGIWKDGSIFVGGNTMLNCFDEENAKMIADTFNRFFELLKENKQLKGLLENATKICSVEHKYASAKEDEAIILQERIKEVLEYIEVQDNFVDYKGYDNKPKQELFDVVEILKGKTSKEDYILDFTTLRKILSKKSNKLLDEFIEYIDCNCESYSLINIVRQTDNYGNSDWNDLITSLNKDLQGYDVAMEDEEDLTDNGYDFLILYTQKEILEEHRREYNLAVFGQESGVLN